MFGIQNPAGCLVYSIKCEIRFVGEDITLFILTPVEY